ncbi:quinone oxidoreductase [Gnomoniopsis smithogilvyi]|uniref:Dehydrogenase FUB6 n=1 Tax=Gnomoniopsis smithogilvyi TaxID=1191159 RepID=A0A9W8Z1T4_9PEZI|nr:quinone oxidoreductase [Gnomoniopsis smithogilvyi]
MPQQTKQWVFSAYPEGLPTTTGANPTFKLTEKTLPELPDGQVLLKNLYFSNDPAQRTWIDKYEDESRLYVPPVKLGNNMRAGAIAEVIESKASNLKKGDHVIGASNEWTQYAVVDAKGLSALQPLPNNLPITHYHGALGLTGLTAYHGLVDVGKATKDDVLVVSGAAGATGSMVVQIAKKMIGVKKVIGLAGGPKKCEWVKKLGADECIDYKTADWKAKLAKAATGSTLYYDNVGGEILDLMLTRLEKHGRVIACGAISSYNDSGKSVGPENWFQIISMSLRVEGFIVLNYADKFAESRELLVKALEKGQLDITEGEHVVDTKFEDVPKTWLQLFEGGNTGKLITKLI